MSLPEKNIEQIEAYLAHTMDAGERAAFEAELQSNTQMQDALENRQQAHLMLDVLIADELKQEMQAFESQAKVVSLAKRKKRRFYNVAIAACIAAMVGAFAVILPFGKGGSSIPMAYYDLPSTSLRGGESNLPQSMQAGLNAFENKDYAVSMQQLQTITSDNPYYIEAQYYLGHAAYNAKNYTLAENAFSVTAASGDARFAQNSDWYGLLNCLAQDQNCTSFFEKILETSGHSYTAKTQELKERIN